MPSAVKEIAAQIVAAAADYLEQNQGRLYEDVFLFEDLCESKFAFAYDSVEVDKGHGRIEIRHND